MVTWTPSQGYPALKMNGNDRSEEVSFELVLEIQATFTLNKTI